MPRVKTSRSRQRKVKKKRKNKNNTGMGQRYNLAKFLASIACTITSFTSHEHTTCYTNFKKKKRNDPEDYNFDQFRISFASTSSGREKFVTR